MELFSSSCGGFGGRRRGCGGGGGFSLALLFVSPFLFFFFQSGSLRKKRRGREMRRKEEGGKRRRTSLWFPTKKQEEEKLSFPTLSKLTQWGIEKSFKIEIEFFRTLGGKNAQLVLAAAQIPSIYTTLYCIMLVFYGGNTLPPDCPPFYAVRFPRGGRGGGAEAYPQEN